MPLWSTGFGAQDLEQPFSGFDKTGLKPLLDLFQSDSQARLLLGRARQKLGFSRPDQIVQILAFCEGEDVDGFPQRRGVLSQYVAAFYREKGQPQWREETAGGLAMLADPQEFPVLDEKRADSRHFERRLVAFQPKICLARGLTVLQTYLVLYHELTHLVGSDPFSELDLASIDLNDLAHTFYYRELSRKGGEVEAYLSQIQAYQRLRKRFRLDGGWVLEDFLNPKGRLDFTNRSGFMDHLLVEASYQGELNRLLAQQVAFQTSRANAWREYLENLIGQCNQREIHLAAEIERLGRILDRAAERGSGNSGAALRDELDELRRVRILNRRRGDAYRAEATEYAEFSSDIALRFPFR